MLLTMFFSVDRLVLNLLLKVCCQLGSDITAVALWILVQTSRYSKISIKCCFLERGIFIWFELYGIFSIAVNSFFCISKTDKITVFIVLYASQVHHDCVYYCIVLLWREKRKLKIKFKTVIFSVFLLQCINTISTSKYIILKVYSVSIYYFICVVHEYVSLLK